MKQLFPLLLFAVIITGCSKPEVTGWVSTTEASRWNEVEITDLQGTPGHFDVEILVDSGQQTINGFGTCFNELGWTSLSKLSAEDREDIMKELFAPGTGANFTVCRVPVGANDFSRDWYSYDETEGDFAMENFSIDNDKETLIPYIRKALNYNPALKIWASPWCPPSWMKYNKHYASRSSERILQMIAQFTPPPGANTGEGVSNGPAASRFKTMMDPRYMNDLPLDREGREGTDMFIQEDKYLEAYALYFSKFIKGYREEGIDIFMVMPQNEFNSAQNYPSCCWTAKGLARFIGSHLGPAMEQLGVEVYFGTMERATEALVDTVIQDPKSGPYIEGVGFQWAGKNALPGIHKKYPDLLTYQTEQECGNGMNDWAGAMHSWDLMKYYLNNGVSVYEYWNTSLLKGGISRWGWAQNSLVVVDSLNRTYDYTLEYYLLKHTSHFVVPGARKLKINGEYDDILAFKNPDNSIIIIAANQQDENRTVNIQIGNDIISPELKANSVNTLVYR